MFVSNCELQYLAVLHRVCAQVPGEHVRGRPTRRLGERLHARAGEPDGVAGADQGHHRAADGNRRAVADDDGEATEQVRVDDGGLQRAGDAVRLPGAVRAGVPAGQRGQHREQHAGGAHGRVQAAGAVAARGRGRRGGHWRVVRHPAAAQRAVGVGERGAAHLHVRVAARAAGRGRRRLADAAVPGGGVLRAGARAAGRQGGRGRRHPRHPQPRAPRAGAPGVRRGAPL
ncbi:hypothetical protein FGB62_53g117 [Gracilaria domingensis]|nr:hypothetical protein FGB62_53g117 [Gracilaria domingensis]